MLAATSPETILAGAVPRLIDEWQLAPELWNAMRHEIDARAAAGQFILSGSARPADEVTRHSGAGRVLRLKMRPMSLAESGESTAQVSLGALLEAAELVAGLSGPTVPDYCRHIVRGGWPSLLGSTEASARRYLDGYVDNVSRLDLNLVPGATRRDPQRVRSLLRALARNLATEAAVSVLAREAGSGAPLSPITVRTYIDDLSRLYVVEELPAWHTHLRSKVRLRTQPRWHFVDPSLAASLLRVTPERLLTEPTALGLFFESLVIRDLRVYGSAHGAEVFHYRDETGLEVDAIVERRDGTWLACEIKLGGEVNIDTAASNLKALAAKVSEQRRSDLRGLVVITGGRVSYTRSDGVHVVALGHLAA